MIFLKNIYTPVTCCEPSQGFSHVFIVLYSLLLPFIAPNLYGDMPKFLSTHTPLKVHSSQIVLFKIASSCL